ncbi:SDR family oxidoreductase [Schleiferiaceae bacterium]|nr:SDR family oxidoreductase [Schleiferiaceae bacterium]
MLSSLNLENKIVVVTGGYGHLGSALVEGFLQMNAHVVVAGRSQEKFDASFAKSNHSKIEYVKIDVLNSDAIIEAVNKIIGKHKRIDVWVNNAHAARGKGQYTMADDDWAYTMEGVLGSVHKCLKAVAPIMKNQKYGKIINVSSMYGIVSPDFRLYEDEGCEKYLNPPHYGAAKAGIIQLTKYFAVLLGKYNINVNAITPGPFPKKMIQDENPVFIERLKSKNPMLSIGKPEDIQGIAVLLSSDASRFITGQNFIIDGGWTIW